MKLNDRIFVAGHSGLVGSAVCREFQRSGFQNILTVSHHDLDLTDRNQVRNFYNRSKPDIVIVCSAKVGGIGANSSANAQFLYENELIAMNTIYEAYKAGVKRLLFLGSTCIYPRLAEQPISERSLLTSPLEKTNEGYALAKISGLKLCQFLRRDCGVLYHSLMPTNLYGPNDNYDIEHGHVLPTLIRKFETAKLYKKESVVLWGTGTPMREFLHVDDLAEACHFMLENPNPPDIVNVGTGEEVTIARLAEMVKDATGYTGKIEWDYSKPDGTPRKVCDLTLIHAIGWHHRIPLGVGLKMTVDNYRNELANGTIRGI